MKIISSLSYPLDEIPGAVPELPPGHVPIYGPEQTGWIVDLCHGLVVVPTYPGTATLAVGELSNDQLGMAWRYRDYYPAAAELISRKSRALALSDPCWGAEYAPELMSAERRAAHVSVYGGAWKYQATDERGNNHVTCLQTYMRPKGGDSCRWEKSAEVAS